MSNKGNVVGQRLEVCLKSILSTQYNQDGLYGIISAIAFGATKLHYKIRFSALGDKLGVTGETNVHGEQVQKLDVEGTNIFLDVLRNSGYVSVVGGEELENLKVVGAGSDCSYTVLMDPIDGSSNIDVAVSIGSIFGIWLTDNDSKSTDNSILTPGNQQVAAVYTIYGSSTVLVFAISGRVVGFTLDPTDDTFRLTHPQILFPDKCKYYSTNEGNFDRLDPSTQRAIINLRNNYSLRYVGSLVADFHRNLISGGVFVYPTDSEYSAGKLRLMYEANPLSFIACNAGGDSSSGEMSILDIQPRSLHQRTPLIIGNKDIVARTVEIMTS